MSERLRQPQAVIDSWSRTIAFWNKISELEPIYLYYWSHVDRKIISNRCEFRFAPETGVEFSFINPLHKGPESHEKIGEIRYSGNLRLIGNLFTFEVYSHEQPAEPAAGIGKPGTPTAPGIARGRMVGLQTDDSGNDIITNLKFIILSKPDQRLRTTDRIDREAVTEPLLSFFKEELKS